MMGRAVTERFGLLLLGLMAGFSATAVAEAGRLLIRGVPTMVANSVLGNSIDQRHRLGGAALDMRGDDQLSFSVSYFLSDRLSFEYLGSRQMERALRFHDVNGFGTAVQLPPTLTARLHFRPEADWRPYLGAGVNWSDSLQQVQLDQRSGLRLNNQVGYAVQGGVYRNLTEHWVLNFEARYNDIPAELRAEDRPLGSVDVAPLVVAFKLGYLF